MAYQDYEISAADGIPIELFDIYNSDGEHWRLNTSTDDITYIGNVYTAGIIKRTEIIIGGEVEDDNVVSLELSRGYDFTNDFISGPIDSLVSLNIYRQHVANYAKIWSGYMSFISFDKDGVPTCRFDNVLTSRFRLGHRRRCSRLCNHALYKTGCLINQESYKVTGTVSIVASTVITSSQFATESDGYFLGGKLKIGTATRLIIAHATNTVTVDRAFVSAAAGDAFIAYAGCDHTPATCKARFDNKLNFGGNEFLAVDSPFEKNIEL